jgi:hypothetical protein
MPAHRRSRFVVAVVLTALCVSGCDEGPPAAPSRPVTILQLSLTPPEVAAGETSEGTVTLNGPASSGGVEVRLASSDGAAVVPASMTVPAGAVSARFTIRTVLVAADTTASITGMAGGERREVTLRVTAPIARPPALDALDVGPAVVKGGQNAQGTVRLTVPAPAGGVLVNLKSSNAVATVPAGVMVPAGANTATFTITTRTVSLDTQFEITASYRDQTRTAPIRVTP